MATTNTHSTALTTTYQSVGTYPSAYHPPGYQCGNCGQYVYGSHNCYYYAPPVTTHIYVQGGWTGAITPDTTAELEAVKEELKEVRKTLEKLMELAVNDHEEVRRGDDGGGEDESAGAGRRLEGTLRIDLTPDATKHLGL